MLSDCTVVAIKMSHRCLVVILWHLAQMSTWTASQLPGYCPFQAWGKYNEASVLAGN